MKKNICLLVLCIASLCVVAQETKELKQVKLKSGISITGFVTNNTDGTICVTTSDGDQLYYQNAEIASIIEDPSVTEVRIKAEKQANADAGAANDVEKNKGFHLMAELGGGFSYVGPLSLTPCYRINEHFLTGIGVGYSFNTWRRHSNQYMEGGGLCTFARVMYNFSKKRRTPYVDLNAGYCLAADSKNDFNSYFLLSDIGLMFRNRRGNGFNIAFSVYYLPFPPSIQGYGGVNTLTFGVRGGWTFF